MNNGSKLILLLVLAGLLVSCSSRLRETLESRYVTFTPPAERLQDYTRFAFHDGSARGNVLVEGWVQNQLGRLLENKGYTHDKLDPQFTVAIRWDVERSGLFNLTRGYMRPAATTTAWGRYEEGQAPDESYLHTLTVEVRDTQTLQILWSQDAGIHSTSADIRTTSIDLLKQVIEFLPTHGTSVHEAEFLPDPQFDRYAFSALLDRDFTLPGLDSYITITAVEDRRNFNPDDVRAMMDDPIQLAMFVDLLQHGVNYRVSESGLLELIGEYSADGMQLELYVRAQFDGFKYRVTEMRNLSAPEYAALQDEILNATAMREQEMQVFREVKTPRWQIVMTDSMRDALAHSTIWYPSEEGFLPDSVRFPHDSERLTPWVPYPLVTEKAEEPWPPEPYSWTVWYPPAEGLQPDSVRYPASMAKATPWMPPPPPSAGDADMAPAFEPIWAKAEMPDSLLPVVFNRPHWMPQPPDSLRPPKVTAEMREKDLYPIWYDPAKAEIPDSLDFRNPETPWYPPPKQWINR